MPIEQFENHTYLNCSFKHKYPKSTEECLQCHQVACVHEKQTYLFLTETLAVLRRDGRDLKLSCFQLLRQVLVESFQFLTLAT